MGLAAICASNQFPYRAFILLDSTSSGGGAWDNAAAVGPEARRRPVTAASQRIASVIAVDERLYASAPDLTPLAAAAEAEPQGGTGPAAAGAAPDIAAAAAASQDRQAGACYYKHVQHVCACVLQLFGL